MSDVPKYRESSFNRMVRLALGKPHIYWDRCSREWFADTSGERYLSPGHPYWDAVGFTIEQDKRWTPVQKD